MPYQRVSQPDRTPARLKRQASNVHKFGYLVEGAGECNGFYVLQGKSYVKEGSNGDVEIKKTRRYWAVRVKDDDGEWVDYFTCQQPRPKPPESGWRNAFDNSIDEAIKVSRTLLKNLTEDQLEEIKKGSAVPKNAKKLNEEETAKAAETPQQRKARERMEKRKARMEARRKGGKKGGKNKKKETKKGKQEEEVKEETLTPEPAKAEAPQTPEKNTSYAKDDEENVNSAGNVLEFLFQKLQPRYGKYRESFEEFGVSDLDMLKEIDNDSLVDLGVDKGLERKVMLKTINQVIQGGMQSTEVPVSAEDKTVHKQMKLKRTQLQKQIKRLEAKKEKLEKEVLQLQRIKRELE